MPDVSLAVQLNVGELFEDQTTVGGCVGDVTTGGDEAVPSTVNVHHGDHAETNWPSHARTRHWYTPSPTLGFHDAVWPFDVATGQKQPPASSKSTLPPLPSGSV
jgi:hypothetical protein